MLGHNHKYVRYIPQNGIQYITAGRGGHDATGKEGMTKGPSSNTVGVVKCRVEPMVECHVSMLLIVEDIRQLGTYC